MSHLSSKTVNFEICDMLMRIFNEYLPQEIKCQVQDYLIIFIHPQQDCMDFHSEQSSFNLPNSVSRIPPLE